MWKTNEGGTKFLSTMKLVPPKYPGNTIHPSPIH